MNENTWLKLYRKLGDHDVMTDPHGLQVFIWIITHVDKKGELTIGRFEFARQLHINPNTLYSAIKRLEKKWQIINTSSNNKFTTIRLLNWAKYQSSTQPSTPPSTTAQQRDNTLIRIKNKELISNDIKDKSYGDPQISLILKQFERHLGHIPLDKKPRYVAHNIRQIVNTFVRSESERYKSIRGLDLTPELVLERFWKKFMIADFADKTQRLETIKQHLKVYLSEATKNFDKERMVYEQKTY